MYQMFVAGLIKIISTGTLIWILLIFISRQIFTKGVKILNQFMLYCIIARSQVIGLIIILFMALQKQKLARLELCRLPDDVLNAAAAKSSVENTQTNDEQLITSLSVVEPLSRFEALAMLPAGTYDMSYMCDASSIYFINTHTHTRTVF